VPRLPFALVLLLGCGDGTGRIAAPQREGAATVGGQVVSTVNGTPITVEEVAALTRKSRLDPGGALRRLQAERLLMEEAERRGLRRVPEARQVARQALAQALLDEEAATVRVSDGELREAYEKARARFVFPERRASLHVLASVGTPADDAPAHAFIRRVRDELAAAPEPEDVWARYQSHAESGLRVSAERIPAVDREAPFVGEYLDALFGVASPSVVAEPVRTRYGWHAIVVTEILPASDKSLEEAEPVLRAELLVTKGKAHVDAFLRRLARDVPVQVRPDATKHVAGLAP
jgi:hypothetical protein